MIDHMVKILCDLREKAPKDIIKLFPGNIEMTTLQVGDYACSCSCSGFERKEMDIFDLGRTLTQVSELQQSYKHSYLIITMTAAAFHNSKRGNKMAKIGFIASLNAQHITPLFEPDYYRMLVIIQKTIMKNHDGKMRDHGSFIHQRHVSMKDVNLNILTTIPGIGKDKAMMVLEEFNSLSDFFNASKKELQNLPMIGTKTAEKIYDTIHMPFL